jgi:hypothetical protein
MDNILTKISFDDVKKIFGNKDNAIEYLTYVKSIPFKELKMLTSNEVYTFVINNWDYSEAKVIVRHLAKNSKYNSTNFEKNCQLYEYVKNIIDTQYDGNIEWAFTPNSYDLNLSNHIRKSSNFEEGLQKHLKDNEKNYIIKSYNLYRSYLYEYFIIKYHEDILPTMGNKNGVDFYYLGKRKDLKNASSVTNNFKNDYGDIWQDTALNNPDIVAKYLYENQNETRFGYEDRIYIVQLNQKPPTLMGIERTCRDLNFSDPLTVDFKYRLNNKEENYTAESLVAFI